MRIKASLLALTVILSLVMTSCFVTSRETGVTISCDDFTKNPTSIRNDFRVEIGDKIHVNLCSNPSTGFEWAYQMSVTNVVVEEDHDFNEPEGDQAGAPGEESWTFEATETGTTTISMEYSQPWDGGIKGEWTYTINVTVE